MGVGKIPLELEQKILSRSTPPVGVKLPEVQGTIICAVCGTEAPRRGPMQKYCEACSADKNAERQRQWARENPPSEEVYARGKETLRRAKELSREAGMEVNAQNKLSIAWDGRTGPDLLWMVRIAVPFDYSASKNHIYSLNPGGHVSLRRESVAMRDAITLSLTEAIDGMKVAHNKVWLDILVQKPNHKGDAVNVVDLVCDAVKHAIPVDDRWFCIRRLDWEIVRENPRMFVGIGQETDEDCQVCCYCGHIKPFSCFNKAKHGHLGIGRECRDCRAEGRRRRKKTT